MQDWNSISLNDDLYEGEMESLNTETARDDVPLLDFCADEETTDSRNPSEWNTTNDRCLIYNNLDLFFDDVYLYFRHKGFVPILLSSILSIVYILIISSMTILSLHCVNSNSSVIFVTPLSQCLNRIAPITWILYFLCLVYVTWKLFDIMKTLYRLVDIKWLYNREMNVPEREIQYFSWAEIQERLILAQERLKFCMLKPSIDELDIHHRLLRFTNYELALFTQGVIRPVFKIPLLGEVAYYPELLTMYIREILFRGPDSVLSGENVLNPEVKSLRGRERLVKAMKRRIAIMAFGAFIFCPLILLFKILDNFYKHTEAARQNPSVFSKRVWTPYSRIMLRHFNELDHELEERLEKAYPIANAYLDSFIDFTHCAIFRFVACVCGSVAALIVLQATFHSDFFFKQGFVVALTILGMLYKLCTGLLPSDDNQFKQMEESMKELIRHLHYVRPDWLVRPCRPSVRTNISFLLTHRIEYIVHEVLSPIFTPFILLFHLRPRVERIVEFFKDYTVSIPGLGDVCSLATLKATTLDERESQDTVNKMKLSLMRFHLANPNFQLSNESTMAVQALRDSVHNKLQRKDITDQQLLEESCLELQQAGNFAASADLPL